MKPLRVLLFSDLHLHHWPRYGSMTVKGQSRLLDGISILDQAVNYAAEHEIKDIIYLGDLNHLHDRMLNSVARAIYNWANLCVSRGIRVFCLVGNHDWDFDVRDHCLHPFTGTMVVVDQSMSVDINGWDLSFIPWRTEAGFQSSLEGALRLHDPDVMFFHHDFADVRYRGQPVGRCGSIASIPEGTLAISGHYHDHIKVNDYFYYIGAPIQHDWGDRGKKRGLYELEVKSGSKVKLTYIRTKYPRFRRILDTAALKKDPDWFRDNFIQLVRSNEKAAQEAFKKAREHARYVDVIKAEDSIADVILKAGQHLVPFNLRFDPYDVIEAAIKDAETDLNKWLLKRIGVKAVKKAMEV